MPVASYISPRFQAVDEFGRPLIGAKLYTYQNKTTTPAPTYQDAAQTSANPNPVILDSAGEAVMYLLADQIYTWVLRDRNDVIQWSQDDISGAASQIEFNEFRTSLTTAGQESGAARLGFLQAGSGAVARTAQDKMRERRSLADFGIIGDGVTDWTDALAQQLAAGGEIWVDEGDYFIAGRGPDSGGVDVTLTRSLTVRCHPRARFYTDSLDNDAIRIHVPSDGAGLPIFGIDVTWIGGVGDVRNQKNSTVIPFAGTYPPANPGASGTSDFLSIRGWYTAGDGSIRSGIVRAHVLDLKIDAGDHWQSAGGDSGIFMEGCADQFVGNSTFTGCRDTGIYFSGHSSGTLPVRSRSEGNRYINCMHGVAGKRSTDTFSSRNDKFVNCVRGVLSDYINGEDSGGKGMEVVSASFDSCGTLVRATMCSSPIIMASHARNSGALLEDGSPEVHIGCDAWTFYGCTAPRMMGCNAIGVNPLHTAAPEYAATRYHLRVESYTDGEGITTQTTMGMFAFVSGEGWRAAGRDTGTNNSFYCCPVPDAAVPNIVSTNATNHAEIRLDAMNRLVFASPALYSDGTVDAPAIARAAQPTVGMGFATGEVYLAGSGTKRLRVTGSGVGFHEATPVGRGTITGSTGGNAALQSLLTYLANAGLITNSTT